MPSATQPFCLYVLAGVNGAGKSSLGGAILAHAGVEYFNPDEAAKRILAANPSATMQEANSTAWFQGKRLLEEAVAKRLNLAFETTLGGKTIPAVLETAADCGAEVRIWYVGLNTPELHIARVQARVKRGGHDIPEAMIRKRYVRSRLNLIHLIPKLTELWVYDNSEEADQHLDSYPELKLILHWAQGKILETCDLITAPRWAKPILLAAARVSS